MSCPLVYYHIPTDRLFLSADIDAHFHCLLGGVEWHEIEILGEL